MSNQDGSSAAAIRAHHLELQEGLRERVLAVEAAVRAGRDHGPAQAALRTFLDTELLPHAAAEERTLYPAGARGDSALLVQAMVEEHHRIVAHVEALRSAPDGLAAATAAAAIEALFEAHLWKENELLLAVLVADPAVSLTELLAGMHELVG